jgi:hypothetical protein
MKTQAFQNYEGEWVRTYRCELVPKGKEDAQDQIRRQFIEDLQRSAYLSPCNRSADELRLGAQIVAEAEYSLLVTYMDTCGFIYLACIHRYRKDKFEAAARMMYTGDTEDLLKNEFRIQQITTQEYYESDFYHRKEANIIMRRLHGEFSLDVVLDGMRVRKLPAENKVELYY